MVPLDIADRTGREDVEIGGRTWAGEENALSCSGYAANKPLLRPAFPGVSCPPAIVGKYKKYFISFDPVSAGDFSFLCLLLSHIDCWLSGTLKGFLYERMWHLSQHMDGNTNCYNFKIYSLFDSDSYHSYHSATIEVPPRSWCLSILGWKMKPPHKCKNCSSFNGHFKLQKPISCHRSP